MVNIVILLIIVAIIAIISLQNAMPVALTFLFWKVETSLSVVIFLSILVGLVMAVVVLLSGHLKRLSRKPSKLEEEPKVDKR